MTLMRILYGLDRLPTTMATDDVRLPSVDCNAAPVRLNSLPLPIDAWPAGEADHAARADAMRSWLLASCGDYNAPLRRGVARYLDAVAAHVAAHRDTLTAGLARFHGLYQIEDWCWSALRPLPRAWWRHDGDWVRADLVFWTGTEVIEGEPGGFDSGELPAPLREFWIGQILPVSPFRRAFPDDADAVPITARPE